jgi:hypothetical protein
MASLAIEFDAGAYRFGNYRYDRLADAVNYARSAGKRQQDVLPLLAPDQQDGSALHRRWLTL